MAEIPDDFLRMMRDMDAAPVAAPPEAEAPAKQYDTDTPAGARDYAVDVVKLLAMVANHAGALQLMHLNRSALVGTDPIMAAKMGGMIEYSESQLVQVFMSWALLTDHAETLDPPAGRPAQPEEAPDAPTG